MPRPASGRDKAGNARKLSWNRHARAGEKTARDLSKRDLAIHASDQLVGEPIDAKRPDVGELRRVGGRRRYHNHGRLQFVQGFGERRAVFHAGFVAQILCAHLPFLAKHFQDGSRVPAEAPLLIRPPHPPDGVKIRIMRGARNMVLPRASLA